MEGHGVCLHAGNTNSLSVPIDPESDLSLLTSGYLVKEMRLNASVATWTDYEPAKPLAETRKQVNTTPSHCFSCFACVFCGIQKTSLSFFFFNIAEPYDFLMTNAHNRVFLASCDPLGPWACVGPLSNPFMSQSAATAQ